jgi:hypothetical protein
MQQTQQIRSCCGRTLLCASSGPHPNTCFIILWRITPACILSCWVGFCHAGREYEDLLLPCQQDANLCGYVNTSSGPGQPSNPLWQKQ